MARGRSVGKLLAEAERMPFGFAKTAVAEEAVRTADEEAEQQMQDYNSRAG